MTPAGKGLPISARLKAARMGLDSVQAPGKKGRGPKATDSAGKLASEPRVKTVEQHSKAK